MSTKNNNTKGIVLRGYKRNDLLNLEVLTNEKLNGELNQFDKNSISIGSELSFSLDLEIGDELTLMSPSGVQTIVGSFPRQDKFEVISIFDSGIGEFNENVAYINLNTLEDFFDKNSYMPFLSVKKLTEIAKEDPHAMIQVDFSGFGFTRLASSIIEQMEYPYFTLNVHDLKKGKDMCFDDVSFCQNCEKETISFLNELICIFNLFFVLLLIRLIL